MKTPFPVLPFGTKDYLFKMTTAFGLQPHLAFYKSFLIRNIKTEDGEIAPDLIKPRFIHFVADSFAEIDLLSDKVIHLFGDAFHYSQSETYTGVESFIETDAMMDSIELHLRARTFRAQAFLEFMDKTEIAVVMTEVLQSQYIIECNKIKDPIGAGFSYQARVTIMPSSAIFREENKLLSPDMIGAINHVLDNQMLGYEKNIDYLFDRIAINLNGNAGAFAPLKTKTDLMEYLRKVILQSTLGETVK